MRVNDLVLAGLLACPSPAQVASGTLEPVEDRLLLFIVRAGPVQVREPIPSYGDGAGAYRLPLGGLGRALGLGIRVEGGRAGGHVRNPSEPFELDLGTGTVRTAGGSQTVDRARTECLDQDIYVDAALLEAWFDLRLDVDSGRAVVEVFSRKELPVQIQWALDQKELSLGRRAEPRAEEPLPRAEAPYALWDPPFINQTLDWTRVSGRKGEFTGSTFLAGDLLRMTSTFFFTSDEKDLLGNVRGSLARRDPGGGLLGPLGATVVELGDLFVPPLALIGGASSGRGFHVGNGLDRWQGQGERTTLRGDLLPGWTVELYRDSALLGFQRSRADGTYAFSDVPLRFGLNRFRLVFYGPEGQQREEIRRFDIRQPLTPEGAFRYNAAAVRSDPGRFQYQGEFAWGLHRQLDLTAAVAQVAAGPVLQRFGMVTLQGYLSGLTAAGTVVRDLVGGTALSGTLATGWGPHALTLQHTWLDGFTSPEFSPVRGAIRSRTRGQLNLVPAAPLPLQIGLEGSRDRLDAGGRQDRFAVLAMAQAHGFSVSNQIAWDRGPGLDDHHGAFRLGRTWSGYALRGEAAYGLDGWRTRVRTLALQADTGRFRPWTVQAGWQRLLADGENRFSLQVNRFEGRMGLNARAEYGRSTGYSVGIGLQISLGWEPRTRRWLPSASPMAYGGAVSARSHVEGGSPAALEGASLKVDGTTLPGLQAPPGVIFQPHLGWGRAVSVELNPASVEDPFLKPRHRGFSVEPRPGKTVLLDFPMVVSGEINGSAGLLGPEGCRPLAGLALELVDADGKVCQEAASAFDGFFELTGLAPGTYTLRVAEREGSRLEVILPPSRTIAITAEEPLREGVSMRAVPKPAPPAPPAVAEPGPAGPEPAPPAPAPRTARRRAARMPSRPPRPRPAPVKAAPKVEERPAWRLITLPVLAIPFGFATFHWLRRLRRRSGGTS